MDPASKPALGDPLKSFPSLRRYFVNMRYSGRHLQRTLVLTDFRSQLIAALLRLGDRNAGHGIPRPAQRNRVTR